MIKFTHFEKEDGTKVQSAKIIGYQFFGDFMEDINFIIEIQSGTPIITDVFDKSFLSKEEVDDIMDFVSNQQIDWDGGYEFIDYVDLVDESPLALFGDRNSKTFDLINSPQNIKNIQNLQKTLNK